MTDKKLHFALYARTSTEDNQSPQESLLWQQDAAKRFVAEHGEIVAVYHDIDASRSLLWRQRPEAARLLADLGDKDRGWSEVVVSESARAFEGVQAEPVIDQFTHYGVRLWIPEFTGPVDPENDLHTLQLILSGGMATSERRKISARVKSKIRPMAEQGRWLGGRPPYGYMLIDLGPHPNPEKARMGARSHALEVNPELEPAVVMMFTLKAEGASLATIVRELTSHGFPAPSAADAERNPHRIGEWQQPTVRNILTNPTYMGRRAIGKTTKKQVLIDPDDPSKGKQLVSEGGLEPPRPEGH
jgi:site-specific DNA recombinase